MYPLSRVGCITRGRESLNVRNCSSSALAYCAVLCAVQSTGTVVADQAAHMVLSGLTLFCAQWFECVRTVQKGLLTGLFLVVTSAMFSPRLPSHAFRSPHMMPTSTVKAPMAILVICFG